MMMMIIIIMHGERAGDADSWYSMLWGNSHTTNISQQRGSANDNPHKINYTGRRPVRMKIK
jgi:hypothetical protein